MKYLMLIYGNAEKWAADNYALAARLSTSVPERGYLTAQAKRLGSVENARPL
jgi:hypothetical protein